MQNIEKTIQSILKKFEVKDDYEKRKLVFWYDKDRTVENDDELEQIKSFLSEKDINLHILNNNFFETKKLLEKDDTESHYLIYSPEAERDAQSNWLLDIQLYSSRFENSKISDIKSELGIEGYDLDKILDGYSRFFDNKKRVSAFKRFDQKNWNEDKIILGMLAALSGSSAIDHKEIVSKLLMGSLNEAENTIWGNIEKFGLQNALWDMIRQRFGFLSEHPPPKKIIPELHNYSHRQCQRRSRIPHTLIKSHHNIP